MNENQEKENILLVQNMKENLSDLDQFQGFSLYQHWRDQIFDFISNSINLNNLKDRHSFSNIHSSFQDQIEFLLRAGFFNDAYEHNVILSIEIFSKNFENPEKIKELTSILDQYVRPKSSKTEDFSNAIDKSLSGVLAYLLSQYDECSERLALSISKQALGHRSDQTVYEALTKIKNLNLESSKFPILAKFILFGILFSKSVNWESIKSRAKQERSISELKKGLNCMALLRQEIVAKELKAAQDSLMINKAQFSNVMQPDLMNSILNYHPSHTIIDDEFVFAVLFCSFFGSKITQTLLPSAK